MKYVKKEQYQNTKHELRNKEGEMIVVESNLINDDSIYMCNKFMFDLNEEFVEDVIDDEVIDEVDTNESDVTVNEEVDVVDLLELCESIEDVRKLAEENKIELDPKKKTIKTVKKDFLKKYNSDQQ